jgi:hypothetical protein
MRECLKSRLVQMGLCLFVFGCGPLLCIIGAAAVGLWPDPHPNPIGGAPGVLHVLVECHLYPRRRCAPLQGTS